MKKFFNTDYPFYYDVKTSLIISVLILMLTVLFCYFFEPFDVNYEELKFSYPIVSLIHATVAFIVFVVLSFFLSKFKRKDLEWKVKYEFVFILFVLIVIGIGQFVIRDLIYNKDDNWSLRYLFEEIRNTLLVGGLFVFIITSINLERLKKIYEKRGNKITLEKKRKGISDTLAIKTQVQSDDFLLNLDEFVFAKSDKNYLEIYLKDDIVLVKRISIKSFEEQLKQFGFILKTHRSYIVNLNAIASIDGNAQGFKLRLHQSKLTVPVSRTFLSVFEEKLATNK